MIKIVECSGDIYLRPFRLDEAARICVWLQDECVARSLRYNFAPSKKAAVTFVQRFAVPGDRRRLYAICYGASRTPIGLTLIYPSPLDPAVGLTGTLIGDSQYRRRGFAKIAREALVKVAFDHLGFAALESQITRGNLAAERLLYSLGYSKEERRDADAEADSAITFRLRRSDWEAFGSKQG